MSQKLLHNCDMVTELTIEKLRQAHEAIKKNHATLPTIFMMNGKQANIIFETDEYDVDCVYTFHNINGKITLYMDPS